MNFASLIREFGHAREGFNELEPSQAELLFGAVLDGGLPDLELGALLATLHLKGESANELVAFKTACRSRINLLERPSGRPMPVVIPTYNGARHTANLTPLLALLLQRFGVPVLLHGPLESNGRVGSAQIFRQLDVMPCASIVQVRRALDGCGLAFAPTAVFSPALAELLALQARMGWRNIAHRLVRMLDPFDGEGFLLASASFPPNLETMREILQMEGANALLLLAADGEPHADPRRRPRLELLRRGRLELLFEAEPDSVAGLPGLPDDGDCASTAEWTRAVLAGESPVPQPLLNQIAACLYGCGRVLTMAQAKALVAVEVHAHQQFGHH